MKRKKALAMLLTTAMMTAPVMGVSAANTDASDTTGSTITGTGDVGYVNTTVYNVGLPTTASMSLTVDPQGLSAIENGDTATSEDLADAAGKITCATIVPITNGGSVPVKVTATLTITGDATVVDTVAAVDTGTANNVLLYAIPSGADTKDAAGFAASSKGVVLTSAGTAIDFIIPAAAYNFSKDNAGATTYVRDTTQDVHGTALKFEGLVNKGANWSDYLSTAEADDKKTLGMTAVFTFTHTLADGDAADTADGAPYAMKALGSTVKTVEVTPATPVTPSSDGSQDITITYTGTATAGSIEFSKPDGTKWTPGAAAYSATGIVIDATNSTITLKAAWLAGAKSGNGVGAYSLKIGEKTYPFEIE